MPDSSLRDSAGPVRVGRLLIAVALSWLAGQVLAIPLTNLVARVAHFHGSVSALLKPSAQPPWWLVLGALSGIWLGFAGGVVLARRWARVSRWPRAWRFEWGDLKYVVIGVGSQFAVGVLYVTFHLPHQNQPVQHIFGASHGWELAVVGALTILGAPFFEEWLFRGVLFLGLAESASSPRGVVGAALVSGVVFGGAHLEWVQFPGLTFVGAVLAWVAWRTQRLAPAFVAHASFNAVAFGALLVSRATH